MKVTCPEISPLPTPLTCPFLIMFITSYPCSVRPAVSTEKKPIPGLTSRLMNRWSCSIRLFRYLTCLSSTDAGRIPAALRSAIALGYAAFLSTLMTRGADARGVEISQSHELFQWRGRVWLDSDHPRSRGGGDGSATAVGSSTCAAAGCARGTEPAVECSAFRKKPLAASAS